MQNSQFSSLVAVVTIASTHCAYPLRDGQAEMMEMAVGTTGTLNTCKAPTTNIPTLSFLCSAPYGGGIKC